MLFIFLDVFLTFLKIGAYVCSHFHVDPDYCWFTIQCCDILHFRDGSRCE